MPYEQLMQGFHQWKERTTTSPSGLHLGIYKSLLKDDYKTKSLLTNHSATSPSINNVTDKSVKIPIFMAFSNAMNPWEIIPVLSLHKDAVPGLHARSRSASLSLRQSGQT